MHNLFKRLFFLTMITLVAAPGTFSFAQDDIVVEIGPDASLIIVAGTPTAGPHVTFRWNKVIFDEESFLTLYSLSIDEDNYSITTSLETSFSDLDEGEHTATLYASSDDGVLWMVGELSFLIDTTPPVVSPVDQTAGTTGGTWFTAQALDELTGIQSCELAINGTAVGQMENIGPSTYALKHTFAYPGIYTVFVACLDAVNNAKSSTVTTVTISTGPAQDQPHFSEGEGVLSVALGNLIKTPCAYGAAINDPCKAVYWYGNDGKRHAFPNEKAYFTWFDDFDDVVLVAPELLGSMALGKNVTYRPGTKMVKFPSIPTVYTVDIDRTLRVIDSETIASALYGSDWNTKIDDVSEAFYFNYNFGDDVISVDDYHVETASASATSPDDLF